MSRWRVLIGLICGLALFSVATLYFVTREQPTTGRVPDSAPKTAQPRGDAALEAGTGRAQIVGPTPVVKPTRESQIIVSPLFDTKTRFKPGETAALEFRAQNRRSGEPASRVDVAVSVIHMPERSEERLPVREVGEGVYEAEFTPRGPGQFIVSLTSNGLPAGATVPVRLGVVGVAGGGDAAEEPDVVEVASGHARILTGGSRRKR